MHNRQIIFLILVLSFAFSCQTLDNSGKQNQVLKPTCNETKEIYQKKIDSLLDLPIGKGDLTAFETSGWGQRLKFLDRLIDEFINNNTCDSTDAINNMRYFRGIAFDKEKYYKSIFKAVVEKEANKNSLEYNAPTVSIDLRKDEDFAPIIIVTIQNNSDEIITSLKFLIDQGDNSDENKTCSSNRILKVKISPYSQESFRFKIGKNTACFNSETPKVNLIEYLSANGNSYYTDFGLEHNLKELIKDIKSK